MRGCPSRSSLWICCMQLPRRSSSFRAISPLSSTYAAERGLGKVCERVKMARTPREKMSMVMSYLDSSSRASRGMYMEAPGALVMVAVLRLGAMRATPRSAILATIPEFKSTFLADRSRWMIGGDWLCRKDRPRATSCRTVHFRPTEM